MNIDWGRVVTDMRKQDKADWHGTEDGLITADEYEGRVSIVDRIYELADRFSDKNGISRVHQSARAKDVGGYSDGDMPSNPAIQPSPPKNSNEKNKTECNFCDREVSDIEARHVYICEKFEGTLVEISLKEQICCGLCVGQLPTLKLTEILKVVEMRGQK